MHILIYRINIDYNCFIICPDIKKYNFFVDKYKNYYYNHIRSLIIKINIKLYVKVYYERKSLHPG